MLLVSDSARFLEELAPAIEQLGHDVARSSTRSGEFQVAMDASPKLVVMDVASLGADAGRACAGLMTWVRPGCTVLAVGPLENGPRRATMLAQIADGLARNEAECELPSSQHDYGFMTVEIHRREVVIRGTRISLTPIETHILSVLAANVGNYVSAQRLVEQVYGYRTDEREAGDIIRVHIHNLRQRLTRAGMGAPYILCGRGRGYRLDRRVQVETALVAAAVAGA